MRKTNIGSRETIADGNDAICASIKYFQWNVELSVQLLARLLGSLEDIFGFASFERHVHAFLDIYLAAAAIGHPKLLKSRFDASYQCSAALEDSENRGCARVRNQRAIVVE